MRNIGQKSICANMNNILVILFFLKNKIKGNLLQQPS